MSILSIVLLMLAFISLIVVVKTKKLNIVVQRILFFGFFGLVVCCIPETIHKLFSLLYYNWLEVLFNNWFDKDAFALMIAKALAWLIIIAGIWLIVWALWRLYLVMTRSGIRSWGAILISILIFIGVAYAEFFNGIYTFSDIESFFKLKTAANAQFELLPNKVIYFESDDPLSEICQAEKLTLITDPNNYTILQLKIDGDVYVFRNTAAKDPGFYPLND